MSFTSCELEQFFTALKVYGGVSGCLGCTVCRAMHSVGAPQGAEGCVESSVGSRVQACQAGILCEQAPPACAGMRTWVVPAVGDV